MNDKLDGYTHLCCAIFGEPHHKVQRQLSTIDISELERSLLEIASINQSLDRGVKIIRMRFGIGMDPLTLRQIAKIEGVSNQRIYQIQQRILRRLRHPLRSRPMRIFLEEILNDSGEKRA